MSVCVKLISFFSRHTCCLLLSLQFKYTLRYSKKFRLTNIQRPNLGFCLLNCRIKPLPWYLKWYLNRFVLNRLFENINVQRKLICGVLMLCFYHKDILDYDAYRENEVLCVYSAISLNYYFISL